MDSAAFDAIMAKRRKKMSGFEVTSVGMGTGSRTGTGTQTQNDPSVVQSGAQMYYASKFQPKSSTGFCGLKNQG